MTARVVACHWCPTGYAYANADGSCSCRIASPPEVVLYAGELAALEHESELHVAHVLEDQERVDELRENVPPQYEQLLASAITKLRGAP